MNEKLCLLNTHLQWQIQECKYQVTNAISIIFICRFYIMLLSWVLLITLVGIYTINNNKAVHSKSTTIVHKTKRILRSYPKQRNLKTEDKFELNRSILSKPKGLKMSSNQGILMLFIICYFLFLRHSTFRKPHLFWLLVKLPPGFNYFHTSL